MYHLYQPVTINRNRFFGRYRIKSYLHIFRFSNEICNFSKLWISADMFESVNKKLRIHPFYKVRALGS